MLTIQPVSVNRFSNKQSFTNGFDKDSINAEKRFYEEQIEELDELLNDDLVPERLKKPFRFFRALANGALEGLAVFGSTMILASFGKKNIAKIKSSKFADNAVKNAKNIGGKMLEILSPLKDMGVKLLTQIKESNFVKNIFEKVGKFYDKFADSKTGKKVIEESGKITEKISKEFSDKIVKPLKNIDSDKVTKGTAGVLGVGSGISGAYETTLNNGDEYIEGVM